MIRRHPILVLFLLRTSYIPLPSPGTPSRRTPSGQPSNSSVHVCWHRATSVHSSDYVRAAHNQLSGYLLRKFKNSMGWQKLWVVFTNFCLFFYKTFQVSVVWGGEGGGSGGGSSHQL